MKRPSLLVPVAAAIGLLLASGRARADAAPKVTWWIEAVPWSCARFLGPVARAVQEACDAGGGRCGLAANAGSASRRLLLFCEKEDGAWRVSGETADRAPQWETSFDGEIEDRPGKIGRFVARGELPHAGEETPPAPRAPRWRRQGGLSLDAFYGGVNLEAVARGLHGVVAFPHRDVKLGLAVAYAEQSAASKSWFRARLWRAGAVVALGAPWDSHVVGCALEVGATLGQTDGDLVTRSAWMASPYAQWSMAVQIPVQPVRPWVGVSATFVLDQFGDAVETLSLVGGVAWNAW